MTHPEDNPAFREFAAWFEALREMGISPDEASIAAREMMRRVKRERSATGTDRSAGGRPRVYDRTFIELVTGTWPMPWCEVTERMACVLGRADRHTGRNALTACLRHGLIFKNADGFYDKTPVDPVPVPDTTEAKRLRGLCETPEFHY
jgi:hypothetical protein